MSHELGVSQGRFGDLNSYVNFDFAGTVVPLLTSQFSLRRLVFSSVHSRLICGEVSSLLILDYINPSELRWLTVASRL